MKYPLNLKEYFQANFYDFVDDRIIFLLEKFNESLLNPTGLAIAIYRIQNQLYKEHTNINSFYDMSLNLLSMIQRKFCSCEIYYSANIGNNFVLVHGIGTIIGSGVVIGNNCTIYHNVTLGTKYDTEKRKYKIGENVIIYAGAKVLGNIEVGDNAVIGSNSVILKDVPCNEIWGGVPGKKIGYNDSSKYKLGLK